MNEILFALLVGFVIAQLQSLNTTVYLHRKVIHGALTSHPAIEAVCKFWNWITSGILPLEWAAVHRKHHQFTDQEGDPRSPHLLGFRNVFFRNVALYRKEAKNPDTLRVFIQQKEWSSCSWFDTHIFPVD